MIKNIPIKGRKKKGVIVLPTIPDQPKGFNKKVNAIETAKNTIVKTISPEAVSVLSEEDTTILSYATIREQVESTIRDNVSGEISAAVLRDILYQLADAIDNAIGNGIAAYEDGGINAVKNRLVKYNSDGVFEVGGNPVCDKLRVRQFIEFGAEDYSDGEIRIINESGNVVFIANRNDNPVAYLDTPDHDGVIVVSGNTSGYADMFIPPVSDPHIAGAIWWNDSALVRSSG